MEPVIDISYWWLASTQIAIWQCMNNFHLNTGKRICVNNFVHIWHILETCISHNFSILSNRSFQATVARLYARCSPWQYSCSKSGDICESKSAKDFNYRWMWQLHGCGSALLRAWSQAKICHIRQGCSVFIYQVMVRKDGLVTTAKSSFFVCSAVEVPAEVVERAPKLLGTSTSGSASDCAGASIAEGMKTKKGLRINIKGRVVKV